jgi:hypothetical protein
MYVPGKTKMSKPMMFELRDLGFELLRSNEAKYLERKGECVEGNVLFKGVSCRSGTSTLKSGVEG